MTVVLLHTVTTTDIVYIQTVTNYGACAVAGELGQK